MTTSGIRAAIKAALNTFPFRRPLANNDDDGGHHHHDKQDLVVLSASAANAINAETVKTRGNTSTK